MSGTLRVEGNQILGLQRQTGDTCDQLEDGTWEATVRYICRWANVMALAPRRNSARHPDFPSLQCKGCKISRLKPGIMAQMDVTYRGILSDASLPDATEEVITSTSEAPVETHPHFTTIIGGTAAAPLNGAVFDKDGKFTGWKSDSQFAGKESYLIPSTIYRKNTPSRARPLDIGPVGTIRNPGIGGGPLDSNWMFTVKSWRRDGGVYEITEEYMLSGPGGWDPILYPG
jgi:hypothetical protein